jgi:2-iminobutanoate/2-iminopropanoate deaminase
MFTVKARSAMRESKMGDIQFVGTKNEFNLPISKAAVAGDFMYTWGYGEALDANDPKAGMRKVFEHLKGLLAEKGLTFADVVRVQGLLVKPEHFKPYNEVYREYFKEPYPVRTSFCVVSDEPILEVDLVAYKKGLSAGQG